LFFVSSRRKTQSVNPDDLKAKPTYTEKQVENQKVVEPYCLQALHQIRPAKRTVWVVYGVADRVTAKARKGKNRRDSISTSLSSSSLSAFEIYQR
jgi:hypothetical protein